MIFYPKKIQDPFLSYEFCTETLSQDSTFLLHQVLVQRALSAQTLYDELLIYHETGTGKTGVAFAVAENLLQNGFEHVYFLAKGDSLLKAHVHELVFKYSKDRFLTTSKSLSQKRMICREYSFRTFETFARALEVMSEDSIVKKFEHSVFIIDEVHNIKADSTARIYKQLHRLFHIVRDRKVLLLTATPYRNHISELKYLMNLILPLNEQLNLDDQTLDEMKLRNRISYYRPQSYSDKVKTRFVTNHPNFSEIFIMVMDPFQRDGYMHALQTDKCHNGQQAFYTNSRQASLYIPPTTGVIANVTQISQCSRKYAFVLRNIQENPRKLIYIFCPMIHGSGLFVLVQLLQRFFGYSESTGNEKNPGKRYILLTSETTLNVEHLIRYFNHPVNYRGEYCHVILGSRKVSEGFTFRNIQIIHILSQHWNFVEGKQAIARGVRFRSHEDLLKEEEEIWVEIYQHVLLPQENDFKNSIDFKMFGICTQKKKELEYLDGVMEQNSIEKCLKHDPISTTVVSPNHYFANFIYFYSDCLEGIRNAVYSEVRSIFAQTFQMHEDQLFTILRKTISTYPKLVQQSNFLQEVVHSMIQGNYTLQNCYGLFCYLRKYQNTFFLVHDVREECPARCWEQLRDYCERPPFWEQKPLKEWVQVQQRFQIRRVRESITAAAYSPTRMDALSKQYKRMFLEKSFDFPESRLTKHIHAQWGQHIQFQDNKIILSLDSNQWRCFDGLSWQDYSTDALEIKYEQDNPFGYYGIIEEDKFYIRDCRSESIHHADRRRIKKGSNCLEVGFPKAALAEICVDLKVDLEKENKNKVFSAKERLSRSVSGKKIYHDKWRVLEETDPERLDTLVYWFEKSKKEMCTALKRWFADHNLLHVRK